EVPRGGEWRMRCGAKETCPDARALRGAAAGLWTRSRPQRACERADPAAHRLRRTRRHTMRDVDEYWVAALWSIAPTIVIPVLFFWTLRNILKLARTERRAFSKIGAGGRARRGLPAERD